MLRIVCKRRERERERECIQLVPLNVIPRIAPNTMQNMVEFWFLPTYYHIKQIATIMAIYWIVKYPAKLFMHGGYDLSRTHCSDAKETI